MKIKTIDRSNKNVNIIFEDESTLEVDESDYLTMTLYSREELSKEECEYIKRNYQIKKARIEAIKYVSYKIRSCKEVYQRLLKLDFDADIIRIVIESLIKDKYLDDLDYAQRYARTKIKLNKISRKQLEIELSQKGISDDMISSLQEIEEIDEYGDIKRLLLKKYNVNELLDSKIKLKAMKFLFSKGYGIELIKRAIEEVSQIVD